MRARTIYLIKRAEVASRSLLETELKDLDLTPSQYATLSMLASHPDASSSDLARRVLITPQSMSEMIMALDRKALIKRRENAGNRRVLGISLSASGRALLEKAEARVDDLEARMFAPLGKEDLQALRDHLETVLDGEGKGRARRSSTT